MYVPGSKYPKYIGLILTSSDCHTGNFNRATLVQTRSHPDFKGRFYVFRCTEEMSFSWDFPEQDPSRQSIPFSWFTWRFSYDEIFISYWHQAHQMFKLEMFVKVGLSGFPGAKGCTKNSFSSRGSDELFPGILETHITYFIWVQHILPSHSISGWICYSLSSFFPISKYVQEWTASEYGYQPSLKNDGKWRFLSNPFSFKNVQGHTINLAMLNVMNINGEHGIFCYLQGV